MEVETNSHQPDIKDQLYKDPCSPWLNPPVHEQTQPPNSCLLAWLLSLDGISVVEFFPRRGLLSNIHFLK